MSARFTILVSPISQEKLRSVRDLSLYHKECGGYLRLAIAQLNSDTWAMLCKKCKRKIIVKNNTSGLRQITKTAVDGEERTFNHEDAVEAVIQK